MSAQNYSCYSDYIPSNTNYFQPYSGCPYTQYYYDYSNTCYPDYYQPKPYPTVYYPPCNNTPMLSSQLVLDIEGSSMITGGNIIFPLINKQVADYVHYEPTTGIITITESGTYTVAIGLDIESTSSFASLIQLAFKENPIRTIINDNLIVPALGDLSKSYCTSFSANANSIYALNTSVITQDLLSFQGFLKIYRSF